MYLLSILIMDILMIHNNSINLPMPPLQKLPENDSNGRTAANFQFGGNEVTIDKECNLTIKDLKNRIAADLNIEEIKKVEVIFKGKKLDDNFYLNKLNKQDSSLLHIIVH